MRAKRYSVEQIVAKLREAEKLQTQGLTIPQACKRLGISDETFYRWRLKYGALPRRGSSADLRYPVTSRRTNVVAATAAAIVR